MQHLHPAASTEAHTSVCEFVLYSSDILKTQINSDFNPLSIWKAFIFFLLLRKDEFVLIMALNLCFLPLFLFHQSPPQAEDSAGVWQELLHRALLRVPLRPHRDPRRSLWLLATHWPFLWWQESRPGYVHRTVHVDQVHQRWRAGRPRLPHQVHLHRRWSQATINDPKSR